MIVFRNETGKMTASLNCDRSSELSLFDQPAVKLRAFVKRRFIVCQVFAFLICCASVALRSRYIAFCCRLELPESWLPTSLAGLAAVLILFKSTAKGARRIFAGGLLSPPLVGSRIEAPVGNS